MTSVEPSVDASAHAQVDTTLETGEFEMSELGVHADESEQLSAEVIEAEFEADDLTNAVADSDDAEEADDEEELSASSSTATKFVAGSARQRRLIRNGHTQPQQPRQRPATSRRPPRGVNGLNRVDRPDAAPPNLTSARLRRVPVARPPAIRASATPSVDRRRGAMAMLRRDAGRDRLRQRKPVHALDRSAPRRPEQSSNAPGRPAPHRLGKSSNATGKPVPHRLGKSSNAPGRPAPHRPDKSSNAPGKPAPHRPGKSPNAPGKPNHARAPIAGEPERLQKVLARMGVASRREAEEWIKAGRITINGEIAVLGARVGRSDHLRLDGRLIHRHEVAAGQVYLCHRSPGENLRMPEEPTASDSEHLALVDRIPAARG